jgi:SP family general alpha glucoside:H+ symporter-like MFS transporter
MMTVGPCAYSITPEVASSKLRTRSVAMARNTFNILAIMANVLISYQINPTAWNWWAKLAFYWASLSVFCCIWVYFRVPEAKGLTFAEIDVSFQTKDRCEKVQVCDD